MSKGKSASPSEIALAAKEREVRGLISDLNKALAEAKLVLEEFKTFAITEGTEMRAEYHALIQGVMDERLKSFGDSLKELHLAQMAEILARVQAFRDEVIPQMGIKDIRLLIQAFAKFCGYELLLSELPIVDHPVSVNPDLNHLLQKFVYSKAGSLPIGDNPSKAKKDK